MKTLSLDNQLDAPRWDAFVKSHPEGTPFHLTSWMRVIRDTYSFEPLLYFTQCKDETISGIYPFFLVKSLLSGNRIVSIPFSDYCGPLQADQKIENYDVLSFLVTKYGRNVKYIEIRSPIQNNSIFVCNNYFENHILNLLSNSETVYKNFDKKTIQYSIRKSEREGVVVSEENTLRGLIEFCRLNNMTRKKHGIPTQPIKFFRNIYKHIISKGQGFILIASYKNNAIAAGIFFSLKDIVYYKYNASDPSYLVKKTPNHLLTWFAIKKSCENKFRYFHFGRTSKDNVGLSRYKEMWGAQPYNLPYYYYPKIKGATAKEEKSLMYNLFTKIWRRLPNRVSELASPIIIKHIA